MKAHFTHYISSSRKRTAGNGAAFNAIVRDALAKGAASFTLVHPTNPEYNYTVTVKENEPCIITHLWPNEWGDKVVTVGSPPANLAKWQVSW